MSLDATAFPKKQSMRLSPSALNLFLDCPRCFWLDKAKGLKRPRGIFPSLPGGMDRVIKTYFDVYRHKGVLPPELQVVAFEKVRLFEDQKKLDLWRDWKTGLRWKEGENSLSGALDDLLEEDGKYVPFDYKTKGSPTTAADAQRYYQNQLDCYSLLLSENGLPPAGYGILLYYSPKDVSERGAVTFHLQAIRLNTSAERAKDTFHKALSLLSQTQMPAAPHCEYCQWLERRVHAGFTGVS